MNELQRRERVGFPFFDRDFFDSGLDDAFAGFFRPMRATRSGATTALVPAMDVTEHEDHFLVHAELPGFDKEDISISVDRGRLVIEAESRTESTDDDSASGKPVLRERRFGRFVRTLDVGDHVDPENISARYADGVLEVTLPKPSPEVPESKRITIQ